MTESRTFKSGEILRDDERDKLSPADRKRYDLEQKLRGLMKLADNESASEGERENATRAIAKLITRHQIDLALLREQETGKANGPVQIVRFEISVSNKLGLGGIRCRALHRAVISPLGGYSVFFHSSGQSTKTDARLEIYLPEDVVDFAKMLIASLMLQVETSMKVATVQHVRDLRAQWVSKREETRFVDRFRKGYLLSWGSAVGRRVAEGRKEAREEAERYTGKELALLDTTALAKQASKDWDEAHGFRTVSARAVLVSDTGKTAGARDGRRAQLGINEVGGSRQKSLT
jgi:hypothetical protein